MTGEARAEGRGWWIVTLLVAACLSATITFWIVAPGPYTTWEVCVPNGAYLMQDTAGNPHAAGLVPKSERIIRVSRLSYTACGL